MGNTETKALHCPAEWVEMIERAMSQALPAPRIAGPDTVRVGLMIRQSKAREYEMRKNPDGTVTKVRSDNSPRAQLDGALHLVKAPTHAGWHVAPEHVFADIGVSGWAPGVKRPGYDGMMEAVTSGLLDVVIVWSLSRLSRKGALDVLSVIDVFAKHGVRLVSVTEPWLDTDPNNPVGQAILGLTAALAAQESNQKSVYITAALDQIRQRGGHVSGMAPYGLEIDRILVDGVKVGKLKPKFGDEENALPSDHVLDIINYRRFKRMTEDEICLKLKERGIKTSRGKEDWNRQAVYKILRDPRYAGYSIEPTTKIETDEDGNKKRTPTTFLPQIMYGPDGEPVMLHEGIITPEEWWELQELMGRDAKSVTRRKERDGDDWVGVFTRQRILTCHVCGRPMQSNPGSGKNKYPFYTCNTGPGGPKGAGKHSQGVTARQVEEHLPRMAFQRLYGMDQTDPEDQAFISTVARRFAAQADGGEKAGKLKAAKKELEHVQGALTNLAADREAGVYTGPTMEKQYRASVKRLTASEARLISKIDHLEAELNGPVELPSEWFSAERQADPIGKDSAWSKWDLDTRRDFVAMMLDKVEVKPVGRKGNHMPVVDRLEVFWAGTCEDEDEADKKGQVADEMEQVEAV
ncbi:recombinase family protein [Kitasatospora sp. MBT66]|uniref:recombinase family protein n=1 Tax=Kitasatospora sp. MBT66 TaxID=1444769 RepID=UPI001314B359|nr:recombinase family protein [Kitasatospora sp. MBT66]